MNRIPFFILLCATAFSLSAQHRIIYVDSAATGALTGRSWPDAYVDLQDALSEAAHGDEIRLAQGTYFPARDGDRLRSYLLKSGVAVKGGYRGGTVQPDERDFEQYRSILSGDIGVRGDPFDNSTNLILAENCDTSTLLEGLELTMAVFFPRQDQGLVADCELHPADCSGSALYVVANDSNLVLGLKLINVRVCFNSFNTGAIVIRAAEELEKLLFLNCVISKNGSNNFEYGYAVLIEGGIKNLKFDNCSFYENQAAIGAFILNSSSERGKIEILNSKFFDNRTFEGISPAIFFQVDDKQSDIIFMRSNFIRNNVEVVVDPFISGGAGHFGLNCNKILFESCQFIGNHGGLGSAVVLFGQVVQDAGFINCLFANNFAIGGALIYSQLNSQTGFYNCQFQNNFSNKPPSIFLSAPMKFSRTKFINSIFIGNKPSQHFKGFAPDVKLEIDHNLFPNIETADLIENPLAPPEYIHIGPRNLYGLDPLWGQNFRPLHCSPLIDAGDAAVWDTLAAQGVSLLDYAGQPRIKGLAPDIGLLEGEGFGMQLRGGYQGCAGQGSGTLQLRLSGAYPYTYPWQENDSIAIITDLPPGRHRIQVTDALGCTREDSVDIVLPLPLSYSVQVVQPEPNQKGSASISGITGGVPPYQYNWNTGDTTSAVSDLGPGDYRVNISDSGGCVEELQVFLRLSGINEGDLTQQGFQLYPQPTPSGSTAQLSAAWQEPLELQLWDAAGHLVKSWPAFAFVPQADIQAPALPGLYFLSVKGRVSGKLGVLRWMVQ